MKLLWTIALSLVLAHGVFAQNPPPAATPPPAPAPAPEQAAAPAPAPGPTAAPPPPPTLTDIRQVQIQIWISQTDEAGLREIGSNLNYTRFVRGKEQSGSVERVRTETFSPLQRDFRATLPAPDSNTYPDNVRLTPESDTAWTPGNTIFPDPGRPGEFQINAQRGAGLTFSILDADRGTIDGILRGIETRSDSDLISKPELLLVNNGEAEIKSGDEIPFQTVQYTTAVPTLKIDWRSLGVNMHIKATIMAPDLIGITIPVLDVSDRLKQTPIQGLQVPVFSSRKQIGQVLVPNAETLVMGGLSSRVVRKTEKRVPIIGKLPVLGIPFRSRANEALNSNLLIFISPTIVDLRTMKPEMDSALNFWQGNEWQNSEQMKQEVDLLEKDL